MGYSALCGSSVSMERGGFFVCGMWNVLILWNVEGSVSVEGCMSVECAGICANDI